MKHILTAECGHICLFGQPLLYSYPEGDYDTIRSNNPNMEHLRSCLYDARECDDRIEPLDTFEYNGLTIEV